MIDKIYLTLVIVLIMSLVAVASVEIYVFYQTWKNADTVSCNGLWCEFTTYEGTETINKTTNCYMNGEEVNCSQLYTDIEKYMLKEMNK